MGKRNQNFEYRLWQCLSEDTRKKKVTEDLEYIVACLTLLSDTKFDQRGWRG